MTTHSGPKVKNGGTLRQTLCPAFDVPFRRQPFGAFFDLVPDLAPMLVCGVGFGDDVQRSTPMIFVRAQPERYSIEMTTTAIIRMTVMAVG